MQLVQAGTPVVPLKNQANNEIAPKTFLARHHLISSAFGLEAFLKILGDAYILMLYIYCTKERWDSQVRIMRTC